MPRLIKKNISAVLISALLLLFGCNSAASSTNASESSIIIDGSSSSSSGGESSTTRNCREKRLLFNDGGTNAAEAVPSTNDDDDVDFDSIFDYLNDFYYNQSARAMAIGELREFVAIQSVSVDPERRNDTISAVKWTQRKLTELGATTQLISMGTEQRGTYPHLPLPPILIGELPTILPDRPTVLVYGHLDVQKAFKQDGWHTDDPFVLEEKNEQLVGRGSSDDKGPVLSWLNALRAYQNTQQKIPVNIKFLYEAMEEVGSPKLAEFFSQQKKFLENVQYMAISDSTWLTNTKPSLTYGLRGLAYFTLSVSGPSKDLHSGLGGSVYEPMDDLLYMLASLTSATTGEHGTIDGGDNESKIIRVEGLYDDVLPVTAHELEMYEPLEYPEAVACARTPSDGEGSVDSKTPPSSATASTQSTTTSSGRASSSSSPCTVPRWRNDGNKTAILMSRWRYPSLTVHSIAGGSNGTLIARHVQARFSVRLVPRMQCERVEQLLQKHFENLMQRRRSPNTWSLESAQTCTGAWHRDPLQSPGKEHFEAARRAIRRVYNGTEPDMQREAGTIPAATLLAQALQRGTAKNASLILIPLGSADDGAHAQNEKYNVKNFIEGSKVVAAYLYEISKISSISNNNSSKC